MCIVFCLAACNQCAGSGSRNKMAIDEKQVIVGGGGGGGHEFMIANYWKTAKVNEPI